MSSILVTGGSGFIGSALVKALVKDGHAVRVLDDNSRGAPRRLRQVEADIEFIGGDIRDYGATRMVGPERFVENGQRIGGSTECFIEPAGHSQSSG